jgi:2-phospho-L-lactate transferase/gluconeogenesis factor (CofD/UPF0052 family)
MSQEKVMADMQKGFQVQLEAHKQALGEFLNANLMLRAQLNLSNTQLQEINNKLMEANKKIADLEAAPKEEPKAE